MSEVRTAAERVSEIVGRCRDLYYDTTLPTVRAWQERTGGKAIGFLPVYAPREIIDAAGMLPVGVVGGGDQVEIIRGDSYYQSYICHLPRSVVEMGLNGMLAPLSGMVFPSTCDVIRNLSGMWKVLFPDKWAKYLDVPQCFDEAGIRFYAEELRAIGDELHELGGTEVTAARLETSLDRYNRNREQVVRLYDARARKPWQVPTAELYVLIRAGYVMEVEEHTKMLADYLAATEEMDRPRLDNARVVISGSFCEQPPLRLIETLERSGCYIVGDDFHLVTRWMTRNVESGTGDPFRALSLAYVRDSATIAIKYQREGEKGDALISEVQTRKADGVIFAAPSFCDPSLLEQPMLVTALEKARIPYTEFKYAENTGQVQVIGEQAGTFADSIRLWGAQ